MALAEFLAELEDLAREATEAFAAVQDAAALEAARIEFVGARSGRLKDVQKGLGQVDKADKPAAGKRFQRGQTADRGCVAGGRRATGPKKRRQGGIAAIRSHGAGHASAIGASAPGHANHRGIKGHHGPAGVYRGRRAGSRGPLAQLRGPEYPLGTSCPRSAGEFLSGRGGKNRGWS